MSTTKAIKQFRDIENFLVNRYFRTDWKSSLYIYAKYDCTNDECDDDQLDDYVEDDFGIIQGSKELLYPIKNLFMLLRAEYHSNKDDQTHRMFYWIYNPEAADELIKFAHTKLKVELHEVIFNPNHVKFFLDIDMLLSKKELAHMVNYFDLHSKREVRLEYNFEDLLQDEDTKHIAQILIENCCTHLANLYAAATYNALAIKGITSHKIDYCVATRNRPKNGSFKLSIHIIFNVVLPIECCKELYEVIVEEGFNMNTNAPIMGNNLSNDIIDADNDADNDDHIFVNDFDAKGMMFAEFSQTDYSNTLKDLSMLGLDKHIKEAIDAQPYRKMGSLSIHGGYKHEHGQSFCMRLTKNFNYQKYDEPFITRTTSSFLKKINLSRFSFQPAIVNNLGTTLSDEFIANVLNHIGNIPGINPSNWDTITIKAIGVFIRPRRNCSEYCKICERVHDTDNTLLIIGDEEANTALYKCSKNADTKLRRFYPTLDLDTYKPKKSQSVVSDEPLCKQEVPNRYDPRESIIEVSEDVLLEEAAMKIERCDDDDEHDDLLNEQVRRYEEFNRYYCVNDISNDSSNSYDSNNPNDTHINSCGESSSECPDDYDSDDDFFTNQTTVLAAARSYNQNQDRELDSKDENGSSNHHGSGYDSEGDDEDESEMDDLNESIELSYQSRIPNVGYHETVETARSEDNSDESDYESEGDNIDDSFYQTYPRIYKGNDSLSDGNIESDSDRDDSDGSDRSDGSDDEC